MIEKNPAKLGSRKFKQGVYRAQYPNKCMNEDGLVEYRSSWERTAAQFCDFTPEVIEWGMEQVVIPYISPVDGNKHRYFMDLIMKVKQTSGEIKTFLVEIKPKKETKPPRKTKKKSQKQLIKEMATYSINTSKWNAAQKLCRIKGWSFLIWTEDQLVPGKKKGKKK